jgi:thioredoxin reductase
MSTTNEDERVADHDHDVVIIGGGPAGCSAGVFVGREGLDTVIFDRGRSSLLRCGHLENYTVCRKSLCNRGPDSA